MIKIMHTNSLLVLLMLSALVHAQHSASPLPRAAGTPDRQSTVTVPPVQEVGDGEVLRINASLVSVPVTVINRNGQYVVDLQQNDFSVYENGMEQTIAHFSNVDHPFSMVLLIDTSGSTAPFLDQIKDAAKAFVEQLRPADTIRPVYFHGEIKSLTKAATNDSGLLSAAIDRMEQGPIELGTRLYDAVDFALGVLKPAPGRKALSFLLMGRILGGKPP